MPDQNALDPLAGRLDQIIDAHREVMLPDGRTLLATERKALVTFARANGYRSRKLWRWANAAKRDIEKKGFYLFQVEEEFSKIS